jgi:hypothetical protein
MDNIFFIATVISVIFLITKIIEMRYIEKESKPLKLLIKDALLVYFSVIIGYFIIDQLKPIINVSGSINNVNSNPLIFTGEPEF